MSKQDDNKADKIHCCLSPVMESFTHFQSILNSIYKNTICQIKNNPDIGFPDNLTNDLDSIQFQSVVFNQLSLHILGADYQAMCQCLNWFLQEDAVPASRQSWLMNEHDITVKCGTKFQLSYTMPDSFVIPVNQNFVSLSDIATYLSSNSKNLLESSTMMSGDGPLTNNDIAKSGIEILPDKPSTDSNFKICVHGSFNKVMTSGCPTSTAEDYLKRIFECALPIFVYVVTSNELTRQNIAHLKLLKDFNENVPILLWNCHRDVCSNVYQQSRATRSDLSSRLRMIRCHGTTQAVSRTSDLIVNPAAAEPGGLCHTPTRSSTDSDDQNDTSVKSPRSSSMMTSGDGAILQQLRELGFALCPDPHSTGLCGVCRRDANYSDCETTLDFSHCLLHVDQHPACEVASNATSFIKTVTHQHLVFASTVLKRFHTSLLDCIISQVFSLSRDVLVTPTRIAYAQNSEKQLYDKLLEIATTNQLEIMKIISSVKEECSSRISELVANYEAEKKESESEGFTAVSTATKDIQNLMLQEVKLAAADKLNHTINVLRDSVTGTLSRCLKHLEGFDDRDVDPSVAEEAGCHLKKILNAAYDVEFSMQSGSSLLQIFVDRIRQVMNSFSTKNAQTMDAAWKCKTAKEFLNGLSESRLATNMCKQFRSQLSRSHEAFVSALRRMELRILTKLEHDEELKQRASKVIAPQVAQLSLNSRSLLDELLYGMPKLVREIGRGSYGVVFSCSHWAAPFIKGTQLAAKSVVPDNENHWNNLALEFYHSICLPSHPRIVDIYGSVVDRSYGGVESNRSAVLLIMEKMHRDLDCALKRGLCKYDRVRIALEVIEGIRYLHSRGLVHRDIKLKNILLDLQNHAKISDLGFCKPSPLMSGSIVGTPTHMAPELFSGNYDNSVDVFAFGILFWHLCAGTVRLPMNYQTCSSKDLLWSAVKKGARPERLPTFSDEAWAIMCGSWHVKPVKRPLPGMLYDKLQRIMDQVLSEATS